MLFSGSNSVCRSWHCEKLYCKRNSA